MTKKFWTYNEVRRLRYHAERGHGVAEVAVLLARSRAAVVAFACKSKIRFSKRRKAGPRDIVLDVSDMTAPGWHGRMVEMPDLSPSERRIWRDQVRQEGR